VTFFGNERMGPEGGRSGRQPALVTAAVALLALAVLALNAPALLGPYGPLGLILVGLPYGAIALAGALAAIGLWRDNPWGRPLALSWAAVTSTWSGISLLATWGPVIASLGSGNLGFNVTILDSYLPVPFLAGAGYVLLALLRASRKVWRVAAGLLLAVLLGIAVAATASQAQPPIGPVPVEPSPVAP
jgi:hypothetical protein